MSSNKKIYGGSNAGVGFAMFMGFLGALVYYWQNAHSFWMVVLGFLKACIWPALLVYHLMSFLKM